jgi:signal transduction histidine kinase
MMPRLDGVGLTQAIRRDPALATIPVILLSARAGEDARVDGVQSGADDYLTKPFAARDLVARVDVHLRLARVRRNAEAALQASAEQAHFLLAEAEKANRAKDEFLANVSHELRSPLQGILGWLTLLRRGSLDAAQTTRALESIDRSVRLQAQLVQDILEISRIVAGKVTLERVPLDVGTILTTTAEEFAPVAAAKNIHVELRLGSCGLVVGDRDRLQQIFANILTNALKFTPPDGRVTLSCEQDATHVVVSVTDTGEGIDPSFLPRLFDRFSQADTSSTRRYGGLGLGLAIVRHLVELHGGTVTAQSDGRGRGATFRVHLPGEAPDANVPYPAASRTGAVPGLDGVEILLVEDDREALDAMTYALQARGARVRPTRSARAAWAAFRERAPDVVVSDLSMPDEDGYSLLRRIRSAAAESPPAIALTGFTRAEDRARVLSAGFAAHVAKPIDPDWLVRVLADVLSERRLH